MPILDAGDLSSYAGRIMNITVTTERQDGCELTLAVSVPMQEIKTQENVILKRLQRQAHIPGFRAGHVPRAILEKKFAGAIGAESREEVIRQAVPDAFEKSGFFPVATPQVSDIRDNGGEFQFKIHADIRPEIKITEEQITGIPVETSGAAVSDEDVDNSIDTLRRKQATYSPLIEDRGLQKEDFAVIDFKGVLAATGAPIEGGEAEGYTLEIGSSQFIPGFDDQLIGMKPASQREISVSFPNDFFDDALKGKPAKFQVKLQSIKKKTLPEINDAFAKDAGFENVDDMRRKLRESLESDVQRYDKETAKAAIMEALDKRVDFPLPKPFLEQQADDIRKSFERQVRGGLDEIQERYRKDGKTDADFENDIRERARREVKGSFLLDAIAKLKNIDVTREEVDGHIQSMAEMFRLPVEDLRKQMRPESVRYQLINEKVVEFLMSRADIKQKAATAETT